MPSSPVANPAIHLATEKEQEIDRLIHSLRREIASKHRIECWSLGGDMVDRVESVGGFFVAVREGSHEEARATLVDIAETLLKAFNSSEKMRPYLAEFPLSVDRLKLEMDFRTGNYSYYRNRSTERVTLDGGEVVYYQGISLDDRKMGEPSVQVYATESYEEALEKAKAPPEKSSIFLNLLKAIKSRIY